MFTVIAIVGLLLWVEPLIAVIAFGVLGGIYGADLCAQSPHLEALGRVRAAANSERFRIANEALGGIKDIKLLGVKGLMRSICQSIAAHGACAGGGAGLSQVPQFALQAVAFGGIILLCLFLMDAARLASGAALGGILPILGVFAFAGQRLMPELSKLYQSLAKLQAGSCGRDMVHDDLMGKAGSGNLPRLSRRRSASSSASSSWMSPTATPMPNLPG